MLTVSTNQSPFPYAVVAVASLHDVPVDFDDTSSLQNITETLLSIQPSDSNKFLTVAQDLHTLTAFNDITSSLNSLDDHLTFRTFFVGHDISVTDWALWGAFKASPKILGVLKGGQHPHLSRWYAYMDSLPAAQLAVSRLNDAKAKLKSGNKTAASFALGLPGAVDGKVVTRFPPEPSGYLHIGHAKAAILNQYFASMYHGKMIIRFDDTNPTKEREEFEQTILEDLQMLDIRGDIVTHTSDYFDQLYDYAVTLIKLGQAYCDDTIQQQMRDERMNGIASRHRDSSIEDNLKRFAEMKTGSDEGKRWCLRAKISVDDLNKAMRDPVIYRCNDLPHHKTGTTWKMYPIYDFACPVVDSIEGVTHALRTNEYRDRNPQYKWMQTALNLRPVEIWDFSRLNFVYTLLSKRKLHWFVDQKLVSGWDDPRFPTVRGIRRRGLTLEAIRQFMLLQGPSQSIVSLEWDSIWTLNKKIIDPIAPRFWAVAEANRVPATITNGPQADQVQTLPRHKKNPDVGTKQTVFSSSILFEQEDAASFDDQEEITLMDWGNAYIRKKVVGPNGVVTSLEVELHLDGDVKNTKKKITWLAKPTSAHPLVPVVLLDYDYLITKKKLEEEDDVANFVTPVTEFTTLAFSDSNILSLKKGDIIQFERKGYYIYDGSQNEYHRFILIPDGRAASIASKAAPTPAAATEAATAKAQAAGNGAASLPSATSFATPVTTKMYSVAPVYGLTPSTIQADTKMYTAPSIYDA